MILRFTLSLILLCSPVLAQEARVPQSQAEISLSFAPLVKEAAPAVVNIYAKRVVNEQSPFRNDPIFGRFFNDLGASRPRVQNSLGSGVILSDDGIVVSNFHVVGDATDIRVVLSDRREYEARVLLGDEESDLAILQLEGGSDMPHLSLRQSDTVEVGELVLAIGNPFGVGQTVSSGIVSGLARSGTATGNARGYFIQTDAPINPGNSGGALIDVKGNLIGVNTSILTRSGGSNGIGFAIPADLVAEFVAQARSGNATFDRPWAGVTGQSVNADLSEILGLPTPGGVAISDLHPKSPFRAAGLVPGDVILEVDGQPVNTPAEAMYRMSTRGIGSKSNVTFARQGDVQTAEIALILPPEVPARDTQTLSERTPLPGLVVANVNPAVSSELGLANDVEGVVVIDPGPYGARLGLQPGDSLIQINGRDVSEARDVAPLLSQAAPRVQLEARRKGQRLIMRFRT